MSAYNDCRGRAWNFLTSDRCNRTFEETYDAFVLLSCDVLPHDTYAQQNVMLLLHRVYSQFGADIALQMVQYSLDIMRGKNRQFRRAVGYFVKLMRYHQALLHNLDLPDKAWP